MNIHEHNSEFWYVLNYVHCRTIHWQWTCGRSEYLTGLVSQLTTNGICSCD